MRIMLLSTHSSQCLRGLSAELNADGHEVVELVTHDLNTHCLKVGEFQGDLIISLFNYFQIDSMQFNPNKMLFLLSGILNEDNYQAIEQLIYNDEKLSKVGLYEVQATTLALREIDSAPISLGGESASFIQLRRVFPIACAMIRAYISKQADASAPESNQAPSLLYPPPTSKQVLEPFCPKIDWLTDDTEKVKRKIFAADQEGGASFTLNSYDIRVFSILEEKKLRGQPGRILAQHRSAICIATIDGAIWCKILQVTNHPELAALKLPAAMVIDYVLEPKLRLAIEPYEGDTLIDDIQIERYGTIALVYFDFYQGAPSTHDCLELKAKIQQLKISNTEVIILMGGENHFCSGINLDLIEIHPNPSQESWRSVTAFNELILEIINSPEQLTISALRNPAHASGLILALACDQVIAREGVLLSLETAHPVLLNSAYWSFVLEQRLGLDATEDLIIKQSAMTATQASKLNLVDYLYPANWLNYHDNLRRYCELLRGSGILSLFESNKKPRTKELLKNHVLDACRHYQLQRIRETLDDPNSDYHHWRQTLMYNKSAINNRLQHIA